MKLSRSVVLHSAIFDSPSIQRPYRLRLLHSLLQRLSIRFIFLAVLLAAGVSVIASLD